MLFSRVDKKISRWIPLTSRGGNLLTAVFRKRATTANANDHCLQHLRQHRFGKWGGSYSFGRILVTHIQPQGKAARHEEKPHFADFQPRDELA